MEYIFDAVGGTALRVAANTGKTELDRYEGSAQSETRAQPCTMGDVDDALKRQQLEMMQRMETLEAQLNKVLLKTGTDSSSDSGSSFSSDSD